MDGKIKDRGVVGGFNKEAPENLMGKDEQEGMS